MKYCIQFCKKYITYPPLFLLLLLTCLASTTHAATIAKLRRMLDITQHRGGKASPALRNMFDITKFDIAKEEYWEKTIGFGKEDAQNKINKLRTEGTLELYEDYLNQQISKFTNILSALKGTPVENLIFEDIDLNGVATMLADTLASLPNLTMLSFDTCKLDASSLITVLEALKNKPIQDFSINSGYWKSGYNDDNLSTALANTLATLRKLAKLRLTEFTLSQKQFTMLLESLKETEIKELNLAKNDLRQATSFDDLQNLTQLTNLNLNYCQLNKNQLENILGILHKTTITRLEIIDNPGLQGSGDQASQIQEKFNKNNKKITINYRLL